MENGEPTTLSHTIGEYVDLTEGAKRGGNQGILNQLCHCLCMR